jgi:hypothetical protein
VTGYRQLPSAAADQMKGETHVTRTNWASYEALTRERRPPPTAKYQIPEEPGIFAQIWEWIARHWLLYLLTVTVAISLGCLLLDSIRGPR